MRALLVGVFAVQVMGCAGKNPPAKPVPVLASTVYAIPGTGGKLVVLPADGLLFPETANVLNTMMAGVRFSNVREVAFAKVSMEVAQLSLECVEPSASCYQSVGRFLVADSILWAKVDRDDSADGKGSPNVVIRLLDVDAGRLLGDTRQSYATPPTAADMDALLRQTIAMSRRGVASP